MISTTRDRDDKLETDTNFSQYMKQSTDDTQSLYKRGDDGEDVGSEMSKKMYAKMTGVGGNKKNK